MEAILKKLKQKLNQKDFDYVLRAYEVAEKWHDGQTRKSGEPYIAHPLMVAEILCELKLDATTIVSALLHDVLEDTNCTEKEIEELFGKEVLTLVNGVTKLSRYKYDSAEDAQAENYRKLFFAVTEDIRIIFIKLADRLHNMRSLEPLREDKRKRIAKETLEIYAPLAGRLGIQNIKIELEDLSMKYLYPEDFEYLSKNIGRVSGEKMGTIHRIISQIEVDLNEHNIKSNVIGRRKHLYSIFKKIKTQNKTLDEIYDILAIRVMVETVIDCYTVLGVIHRKWKQLPGRFKDYISFPKANQYKSLHTTVITEFGHVVEIQIRTHEMNRFAEYGVAAHWLYKDNSSQTSFDERLGWLKEAIENDGANDSK